MIWFHIFRLSFNALIIPQNTLNLASVQRDFYYENKDYRIGTGNSNSSIATRTDGNREFKSLFPQNFLISTTHEPILFDGVVENYEDHKNTTVQNFSWLSATRNTLMQHDSQYINGRSHDHRCVNREIAITACAIKYPLIAFSYNETLQIEKNVTNYIVSVQKPLKKISFLHDESILALDTSSQISFIKKNNNDAKSPTYQVFVDNSSYTYTDIAVNFADQKRIIGLTTAHNNMHDLMYYEGEKIALDSENHTFSMNTISKILLLKQLLPKETYKIWFQGDIVAIYSGTKACIDGQLRLCSLKAVTSD